MILSQLYNPIIEKGHSLKSWGERLGIPKGEVDSFDHFSEEMLDYCKQDVNVTYSLYKYFKKQQSVFSSRSIALEHKIKSIIQQQEDTGFYLDLPKATTFISCVQDKMDNIEGELQKIFPPHVVSGRTHKRSGKPLADIVTPFNPASRKQIAERLMGLGWKPDKKTDKGNVIVDEAVLETIDLPEAKKISEYLLLGKRYAQVKSWVEAADSDGRVHGRVLTLKTVTGRMAHTSPNMAQVPAVYSPMGTECRSMWSVEDTTNYSLVGTDASGLELRGLAHMMDDPKFTQEILEGDVHTANMKMAGLTDRDQAKTFIYALMYGAGAAKIGKVVGGTAKEGEALISKFMSNMPKFSALKNNLNQTVERNGVIPGLDGRTLQVRSPHAALNTLIQGAGAVICKQWLVQMHEAYTKKGLDVRLVASIHDEYQFEVHNKDCEEFGLITKTAMKEVEEIYSFRCPLDSEYKIGKNWAETH
jgi:DNA polymerase-1